MTEKFKSTFWLCAFLVSSTFFFNEKIFGYKSKNKIKQMARREDMRWLSFNGFIYSILEAREWKFSLLIDGFIYEMMENFTGIIKIDR
jgi:hypothetical protein